jgi:hypothetical protein
MQIVAEDVAAVQRLLFRKLAEPLPTAQAPRKA